MKKSLLTTMTLFFALALTACGARSGDKSSAEQSSAAPASSSVAPASSSVTPASSSETPVASSEEPVVSSEESVASSEVPVESSEAPVESSEISSEAPVESSEAPVESSSVAPSTSSKHVHTYAEEWTWNETNHWHAATCEHTNQKSDNAKHTFEDMDDAGKEEKNAAATCAAAGHQWKKCIVCGYEVYQELKALDHTYAPIDEADDTETNPEHKARAATCAEPGIKVEVCTVCGDRKETAIPTLEHNWEATDAVIAEEDGYAKLSQYKCSLGDHYALRWSAIDLDEAASITACGLAAKDTTYYPEINTSGSHANTVRLRKAENDGGTEKIGTHIIYKIKVGADVTNAGLEFCIDPRADFNVPVFDYVSNDSQQGYIKNENGELVLTTKRYGLRVNGEEIMLGDDKYGEVNGGSSLWFDWNVSFDLHEGENIIDVYCLGGYRSYIHNFQITRLPQNA